MNWKVLVTIVVALMMTACVQEAAPEDDKSGTIGGSCTPSVRACADASNFQVCRADGSGWDFGTCPADQPCNNGLCAPAEGAGGKTDNPVTITEPTEDSSEPVSETSVETGETPDDEGETPTDEGNTSNDNGSCTPLATECLSDSMVRLCRNDGSGWDTGTCPLSSPCENGSCGGGANTGGGEVVNDNGANGGGNVGASCDPVDQDCGAGLKCAPNRNFELECQPDGALNEGDICEGIPSDCGAGTLCLNDGAGGPNICTSICDTVAGLGCGAGGACNSSVNLDGNSISLCSSVDECDPVDSPSCGSGAQCAPVSNSGGACFSGGGTIPSNGSCSPSNDQCADGLTCISIDGSPVCKSWCKVGRGDADCSGADSCVQVNYTVTLGADTREIDAFGICLQ